MQKNDKKDLVTVIHLEEPYTVEQPYEDIILKPPKKGMVRIPEGLRPVICKNKLINKKYAVPLLEICGIVVEFISDKRQGEKRSTPITANVNGAEMIVHLYHFDNWENPPNPLPITDVWFVSRNHDEARIKYRIAKMHLVEVRGFHILSHTCINRGNQFEFKCLET